MHDSPLILGRRQSGWNPEGEPVGLAPADARHHSYVIGQTGSGKSTLLLNLARQHLAAGRGFALLDPHGDLADAVLAGFPSHRADDLIVFNPADLEFPVGLDLLAHVARDRRHLVASGIVEACKSL
jgi:DNA helicase HerA-like ATPase